MRQAQYLNLPPPVVGGFPAAATRLPAEDGERADRPLCGVELHDGLEAFGRVRVHRNPVLLLDEAKVTLVEYSTTRGMTDLFQALEL